MKAESPADYRRMEALTCNPLTQNGIERHAESCRLTCHICSLSCHDTYVLMNCNLRQHSTPLQARAGSPTSTMAGQTSSLHTPAAPGAVGSRPSLRCPTPDWPRPVDCRAHGGFGPSPPLPDERHMEPMRAGPICERSCGRCVHGGRECKGGRAAQSNTIPHWWRHALERTSFRRWDRGPSARHATIQEPWAPHVGTGPSRTAAQSASHGGMSNKLLSLAPARPALGRRPPPNTAATPSAMRNGTHRHPDL